MPHQHCQHCGAHYENRAELDHHNGQCHTKPVSGSQRGEPGAQGGQGPQGTQATQSTRPTQGSSGAQSAKGPKAAQSAQGSHGEQGERGTPPEDPDAGGQERPATRKDRMFTRSPKE